MRSDLLTVLETIEHVWPNVGRMFVDRIFQNKYALWNALRDAFARVAPPHILKSYASMPNRLAAIRVAYGGNIRY